LSQVFSDQKVDHFLVETVAVIITIFVYWVSVFTCGRAFQNRFKSEASASVPSQGSMQAFLSVFLTQILLYGFVSDLPGDGGDFANGLGLRSSTCTQASWRLSSYWPEQRPQVLVYVICVQSHPDLLSHYQFLDLLGQIN